MNVKILNTKRSLILSDIIPENRKLLFRIFLCAKILIKSPDLAGANKFAEKANSVILRDSMNLILKLNLIRIFCHLKALIKGHNKEKNNPRTKIDILASTKTLKNFFQSIKLNKYQKIKITKKIEIKR